MKGKVKVVGACRESWTHCAAADSSLILMLGSIAISHFWLRRTCWHANVRFSAHGSAVDRGVSLALWWEARSQQPLGSAPQVDSVDTTGKPLRPPVCRQERSPSQALPDGVRGAVHPTTIGSDGSRDGGADHGITLSAIFHWLERLSAPAAI